MLDVFDAAITDAVSFACTIRVVYAMLIFAAAMLLMLLYCCAVITLAFASVARHALFAMPICFHAATLLLLLRRRCFFAIMMRLFILRAAALILRARCCRRFRRYVAADADIA